MCKITIPIILLSFLFVHSAYSQVGIGTTNPDTSAALDIESTSSGLLIPRMTENEKNNIENQATGLLIYQTNENPGFYFFDGSEWLPIGGEDMDWNISDNNMYNMNSGNIGIGNTNPSAKIHVTGTTSTGGGNSTIDLLNVDFESEAPGDISTIPGGDYYNIDSDGSGCSEVWAIDNESPSINCSACDGQVAIITYQSCYIQNTLVLGPFTPSEESITIKFDYGYTPTSNNIGDDFRVQLFNETTGSVESTLITNTNSPVDGSFDNSISVTASNSYSIRVRYRDEFNAWGAEVDNILVQESGSGTIDNYVFRLEDGQEQDGYVLTSDENGNATWKAPETSSSSDDQILSINGNQLSIEDGNTVTIPTGGGNGSYTFENGLSEEPSASVGLGGTLDQETIIDLNDYDLVLQQSNQAGTYSYGEFIIEGWDRTVFTSYLEDNFAYFGPNGYINASDDTSIANSEDLFDGNTSFEDSGGNIYTVDVLMGVGNDDEGGSSMRMGSIEYFVDGLDELMIRAASVVPTRDGEFDLGDPDRRWDNIYVSGSVTTSDINEKKNIKKLEYGLSEVLKIEPITFQWKGKNYKGVTKIPENLKETRIGFSAQNLQAVIPEVVKTHSWKPVDEKNNFQYIKNSRLGVYYDDIIPIVVKAIQEQQEEIEDLKKIVQDLIEQNKRLSKLSKN